MTPNHPRAVLSDESGFMMVELVIAMLFLAIAASALISVYTATIVSLRRTGVEGNALTLVDQQIELYNTLRYDAIALDGGTIPGTSGDPYVTEHGVDATIPDSSGQVTGAVAAVGSCASPLTPQPSCATQRVTGPDGRTYRVDTYIITVTPPTAGSRSVKQVTAVARIVENGAVGPIRARIQSAYDRCNPPTVNAITVC